MDWTIVISGAITGAVGIAGVAGTILAARIAGNSARESTRLTIAAQADLAQHVDRRQVYARFMAAFTAAQAVAKEAKSSEEGTASRANFATARQDAGIQANELMLLAPVPVAQHAGQLINRLSDYWEEKCDYTALSEAVQEAYLALRADLDEDAKRIGW